MKIIAINSDGRPVKFDLSTLVARLKPKDGVTTVVVTHTETVSHVFQEPEVLASSFMDLSSRFVALSQAVSSLSPTPELQSLRTDVTALQSQVSSLKSTAFQGAGSIFKRQDKPKLVPVGGNSGQVLAKNTGRDFDTGWVDQTGGGGGLAPSVYSTHIGSFNALDAREAADFTALSNSLNALDVIEAADFAAVSNSLGALNTREAADFTAASNSITALTNSLGALDTRETNDKNNIVGSLALYAKSSDVATQYTLSNSGVSFWTHYPIALGLSAANTFGNAEYLFEHTFAYSATFPASFSTSQGWMRTAPTGTASFRIQKNSLFIATAVFSQSQTPIFSANTTTLTFNPGDRLAVIAPDSADASAAFLSLTLYGNRNG